MRSLVRREAAKGIDGSGPVGSRGDGIARAPHVPLPCRGGSGHSLWAVSLGVVEMIRTVGSAVPLRTTISHSRSSTLRI